MNFTTNSTVLEKTLSESYFKETLITIGVIFVVCCIYYCVFTPTNEESDKRMKWGVERAKARIALRNDLAYKV